MHIKKMIKEAAILVIPLLIFGALVIPYSLFNQQYVVEWFGCGCPKVDELGNVIQSDFNANDFTALFWLFISVCITVLSIFLSKRIPKNKRRLRVVYVIVIFLLSLLFSYQLYQLMMWK